MNGINIYSILITVALCLVGFLSQYLKTKYELIHKVGDFINKAEDDYKSVSKAGNEKFKWVVTSLYGLVPAPMKFFITEQMIAEIVQKAFDKMAEFATKQLDKVVDNV